uniref:Uncharacterized protein n=1 Tax=Arundo donax TaxID=35708 RepID=A0A0A9E373_ARUDO
MEHHKRPYCHPPDEVLESHRLANSSSAALNMHSHWCPRTPQH